jgi:hypothetical protein
MFATARQSIGDLFIWKQRVEVTNEHGETYAESMVAIYQERGIKNLKKGRQKRRKIEEEAAKTRQLTGMFATARQSIGDLFIWKQRVEVTNEHGETYAE